MTRLVAMYDQGFIWIRTAEDFEALEAEWDARDPFDPEVLDFVHAVLSTAQDIDVDRQGRVRIPEVLRELAGIEKSVMVSSVMSRIEVWDAERWEERSRAARERRRTRGRTL